MTQFNSLTPNLMVTDVVDSLRWYERVLDAAELGRMPADSDDPEWAQVGFGDVSVMFQGRDSLAADVPALAEVDIGGSLTLYVDVEDVEGLHERVVDREGASVAQALRETEYGRREFAVEDPDGYVLAFGEKLS